MWTPCTNKETRARFLASPSGKIREHKSIAIHLKDKYVLPRWASWCVVTSSNWTKTKFIKRNVKKNGKSFLRSFNSRRSRWTVQMLSHLSRSWSQWMSHHEDRFPSRDEEEERSDRQHHRGRGICSNSINNHLFNKIYLYCLLYHNKQFYSYSNLSNAFYFLLLYKNLLKSCVFKMQEKLNSYTIPTYKHENVN